MVGLALAGSLSLLPQPLACLRLCSHATACGSPLVTCTSCVTFWCDPRIGLCQRRALRLVTARVPLARRLTTGAEHHGKRGHARPAAAPHALEPTHAYLLSRGASARLAFAWWPGEGGGEAPPSARWCTANVHNCLCNPSRPALHAPSATPVADVFAGGVVYPIVEKLEIKDPTKDPLFPVYRGEMESW